MPNAFVQFIGRKAILRAETPIQAGDEIQLSYTGMNLNQLKRRSKHEPVVSNSLLDYTFPLQKRKEALSAYMFECKCPRCKDDLNVYQACASSPNIERNRLSIIPDLANVRTHPAVTDPARIAAARTRTHAVVGSTDAQPLSEQPEQRLGELKAHYRACQRLVDAELWASSPVPHILTEMAIAYSEAGNFAFALAIACHVAVACDPYRDTAPFHPVRAKGLLMVAKLLANTAADTASLGTALRAHGSGEASQQATQDALQDIDQVSLCEMLLVMVLWYAPASYETEWELSRTARDMLNDIEQLPGREKELSLINAWKQDPLSDQSQAFFDFAVVKQINILAKLGRAILRSKFEQ
jgi:SET and MYND domain-containing protein